MCQLYGLAGCYWAVGAFQKREMKSAVVRAGSTGTEWLRRAAFQETTRSLASGLVRLPTNSKLITCIKQRHAHLLTPSR
jgi:hypothetical protein